MRALSSVASIAGHLALGAAVLFGTTRTKAVTSPSTVVPPIFFQPTAPVRGDGESSIPGPIPIPPQDLDFIRASVALPQTGTMMPSFSPQLPSGGGAPGINPSFGWGGVGSEAQPEVLSGPLPVYPELLRQAGVQGEVLLEAVVDSTGRVVAASIVVVAANHPAFVAAARQALLATLFRPAMVGGRAVQTRVRIPYAFSIRGGTGRAR